MSKNQNILTINTEEDCSPPHLEFYQQDIENELVFVSKFSQCSERNENIRMARFLARKTKENVYVLPHIHPTQKEAEKLRKELFPTGVKTNKNPDFYFRKRFVDAKCMSYSTLKNQKLTKRNIQNRLKEAFIQADDVFLEIQTTYPFKWVEEAINGKLKSMSHFHIVYLRYEDDYLIFTQQKNQLFGKSWGGWSLFQDYNRSKDTNLFEFMGVFLIFFTQ